MLIHEEQTKRDSVQENLWDDISIYDYSSSSYVHIYSFQVRLNTEAKELRLYKFWEVQKSFNSSCVGLHTQRSVNIHCI